MALEVVAFQMEDGKEEVMGFPRLGGFGENDHSFPACASFFLSGD